ncbi:membrane protein [Tsuneonella deserti]|uniref:Membrane protein n=1 Tax=Tsuneonella deserti TaxID=2035528 RepID=A0ABQ1SDD6_9SPHN|nr:peptidoglycan DD-metalloendopeptidase family protein [Tsuneonella deserti]GGE03419.1 membrane protein [Tsuneonella deserti]
MRPRIYLAAAVITLVAGGPVAWPSAQAQRAASYGGVDETRTALVRAQADARAAAGRARRLEVAAAGARASADKTASQAAALAARIQEAEAGITTAQARIALMHRERVALDRRLAARREPLVRLTAGLQKLARRPLIVSVLRPGSLKETVYLRAILDTTLPEVRRRTADLRAEIAHARRIEAAARAAVASLASANRLLGERRSALAALESRQRLASRQATGAAAREGERALALAEQARDLDALVGQLGEAGTLRRQLAALPGPLLRPPRPSASEVIERAEVQVASAPAPEFQLPVAGRTVAGFGEASDSGARSRGLALLPIDGAQVVAPGAGRIVFAGPFRGFDRIVIIEHAGGFTSLVTGLARVDVAVGDEVVAGAPLGVAGSGQTTVGFELRREGDPVNPLEFLG